ncbi:MAG: hypothetical protein KDJ38_10150 [Gammaproteobacteria bacterium]|nr:hypothetical protein [Gammaproteobacteria bacterium]
MNNNDKRMYITVALMSIYCLYLIYDWTFFQLGHEKFYADLINNPNQYTGVVYDKYFSEVITELPKNSIPALANCFRVTRRTAGSYGNIKGIRYFSIQLTSTDRIYELGFMWLKSHKYGRSTGIERMIDLSVQKKYRTSNIGSLKGKCFHNYFESLNLDQLINAREFTK